VANPDFPRRSNHDLRRVFTSVVNNKDLVLPAKLVKMLINHSTLDRRLRRVRGSSTSALFQPT
jgi:hypothetical protein